MVCRAVGLFESNFIRIIMYIVHNNSNEVTFKSNNKTYMGFVAIWLRLCTCSLYRTEYEGEDRYCFSQSEYAHAL